MVDAGGVAGGNPPALIERWTSAGFGAHSGSGVAGGNPPALIERWYQAPNHYAGPMASPGVTPRPSLNAQSLPIPRNVREASPGVTPRPSLNGPRQRVARGLRRRRRRG